MKRLSLNRKFKFNQRIEDLMLETEEDRLKEKQEGDKLKGLIENEKTVEK